MRRERLLDTGGLPAGMGAHGSEHGEEGPPADPPGLWGVRALKMDEAGGCGVKAAEPEGLA